MLKDYFINARYLFGFLGPGALWVAAFLLVIFDIDPADAVANANLAQIVFFLAAGFVVGHAAAQWSFQRGKWLSDKLHELAQRLPAWLRRRLGTEPLSSQEQVDGEIAKHVRTLSPLVFEESPSFKTLSPRDVLSLAKLFVLEKTARLARELDEAEAEVNLRTGLVWPMLIFSAAYLWKKGLSFWPLPVLLCLVAALLLWEVAPKRRNERKLWLHAFLVASVAQNKKDVKLEPSSDRQS